MRGEGDFKANNILLDAVVDPAVRRVSRLLLQCTSLKIKGERRRKGEEKKKEQKKGGRERRKKKRRKREERRKRKEKI